MSNTSDAVPSGAVPDSSANQPNNDSSRGSTPPLRGPRLPDGPTPYVSPSAMSRYNARVLDPSTAVVLRGQGPLRSTVYVGDRLLVSAQSDATTRSKLEEAAKANKLILVGDEPHRALRAPSVATRLGFTDEANAFTIRVRLIPAGDEPVEVDAWPVLQTFRSLVPGDAVRQRQVALDHLLASTGGPHIGGLPEIAGHGIEGLPEIAGHGIGGLPEIAGHGAGGLPEIAGHSAGGPADLYGLPGYGGRAPVAWMGRLPGRRDDGQIRGRRPVVAVLDTGVGWHPWLNPSIVTRDVFVDGVPIGLHDYTTDPERTGVVYDPYEGVLDSDSGHGTFIAGLIRQICPDANVLAIRIMYSDGYVAESDLLDALNQLACRQRHAMRNQDAASLIDVVSLSLGYYHELPADLSFDPMILGPLTSLSRHGVTVAVSAGNDATSRPMFPAAFAPTPKGTNAFEHDYVPLVSVGALNPDNTVAMFSNGGTWVSCFRTGAALVSTFPVTFNASLQPYASLVDHDGHVRQTLDMDDFRGGFGTWSGTSFSAPVFAAEIAQAMVDEQCGAMNTFDADSAVTRGWTAVGKALQVNRP
jgi:Subtilase family